MYRRILLLFVMALTLSPMLGGCCFAQASSRGPRPAGGVVDLSRMELGSSIVDLSGEWEFYWNQLLRPAELDAGTQTGYIDVPSSWNRYAADGRTASGDGYATYRLTFIAGAEERLALKIPRMHTAYRLWVNGALVASAGTVGETKQTSTPQYLPKVSSFQAQRGANTIVIEVSNFHQRSGGILETIRLGGESRILDLRYKSVAFELFLFGALMFIGVYHIILFIFRQRNSAPMYIGLFCILVGIRTLMVGEGFFIYLFPSFNWEIAHKIQTLTYYWGSPLILMFFVSLFTGYFHSFIIKLTLLIGAAFGLLVISTPVRVFSVVNPLYQTWTSLLMTYVLIIVLRTARHKEKGAWLIAIGAFALALTGLNDIIFHSIWRNDYGPSFLKSVFTTGNLSSLGQVIFAFLNSLILAKRFSVSLEREEVMTAELTAINTHLDELVLQRTEALATSNEQITRQKQALEKANQKLREISLIDPLTGIWNRRKYDEAIRVEWYRCLRHQRPIALIMLDIDHFKQFNDACGHMAGDACLTKIANTITASLARATDLVARIGGEEFIALLPEAGKEEVMRVASRLRQRIEALKIPHDNSPVADVVTVSVGAASMTPQRTSRHEDLFMLVDKALYHAKAEGRNRVKYLGE